MIRAALADAELAAADWTALEMHGTGTALGDPIEIGAASAVAASNGGVFLHLRDLDCNLQVNEAKVFKYRDYSGRVQYNDTRKGSHVICWESCVMLRCKPSSFHQTAKQTHPCPLPFFTSV